MIDIEKNMKDKQEIAFSLIVMDTAWFHLFVRLFSILKLI